MPEWKLYVRRDTDLVRLAEIEDFSYFSLVPRFNAVGAWELNLNSRLAPAPLLTWGNGLLVTLDDAEFFSGPITGLKRTWSAAGENLTISGADDAVWLVRRLAYPEAPLLTTATDEYDVRTGIASTVMRAFVDVNAGPSADSTRRVPGLTLGADPLTGLSVTGRGRFQTLDELLRSLALAGGDLGYRIVQAAGALEFQVYAPADKTASVIFSAELGNLAAYEYQEQAPEANFVIVGGGGEGTARAFNAGGRSASIVRHGLYEAFRDRRDTDVAAELEQAREEELDEQAQKATLSAQPVETLAFEFGTDYGLGDRVTVVVDGEPVQDVVREVQIRLSADEGARVVPVVGTPGERDLRTPKLFDRLRQTEKKVRDLERRY